MEEMKFILVGSYQYSSEAYIYKGKLEDNQIEVFVRNSNIVDTDPMLSNAVGGVALYVKSKDLIKAKMILSEVSEYSLDDNGKLIKCPSCGAQEAEMYTTIKDFKSFFAFLFSFLFLVLPFYTKRKYKCERCNYEFN